MATKQYIRIDGNAVHIIQETVQRTVSLEDLLKEVSKDQGVVSPILPWGCRFFSQKEKNTTFVIEQSPTVRNINHNGNMFKIAFPYVIFVVCFSGESVSSGQNAGTRCFFSNAPIKNEEIKLFRPALPNTYTDGSICTGSMRIEGKTLPEKAESFIAQFWQSSFNNDLMSNNFDPTGQNNPSVASFDSWQESTAKNPLFALSIKWLDSGLTIKGVV